MLTILLYRIYHWIRIKHRKFWSNLLEGNHKQFYIWWNEIHRIKIILVNYLNDVKTVGGQTIDGGKFLSNISVIISTNALFIVLSYRNDKKNTLEHQHQVEDFTIICLTFVILFDKWVKILFTLVKNNVNIH